VLDLAFLLNPINPVRFVDKARRLAFGTKSNVVTLGAANAHTHSAPPDWRGAMRRALAYAETILAGYLYLIPVARAALAARRSAPNSLAHVDMKALDGDGSGGTGVSMPRVVNG